MKKITFPVGTHQFHEDPNINYQMNRWTTFGDLPIDVVKKTADKIKNLDDYCHEFLKLAKNSEANGDIQRAAFYYRSVDFFLPYDDPKKEDIYNKTISLMRKFHAPYFKEKRIVEGYMPYENRKLPVWRIPAKGKQSKGNILFTGGFDCLKEELVPSLVYFSDAGYDVYYFEGPGQGEALVKEKIAMTHEWEKPVREVLDHFDIDNVTIIGLSLGGYLAPRAAVFEKRIKRVVTWGIMYDFFKVVTSRRGRFLEYFVRVMLFSRLAFLLNTIVKLKMKTDGYTRWGVDHGMHVMGVASPALFFKKLKKFSLKGMEDKIHQDMLLTSGTEDHFVPISHFYDLMRELKNAKSITGRIFTAQESGENHCQFGNIGLTLEVISNWIEFQTRGDCTEDQVEVVS
jgi:pimeloyl-ACP methyl ester carboxylesterase